MIQGERERERERVVAQKMRGEKDGMMIDFSSIKLQNPGLLYARLVPGSTASEDFRKGHSNYYSCNANRILLL